MARYLAIRNSFHASRLFHASRFYQIEGTAEKTLPMEADGKTPRHFRLAPEDQKLDYAAMLQQAKADDQAKDQKIRRERQARGQQAYTEPSTYPGEVWGGESKGKEPEKEE